MADEGMLVVRRVGPMDIRVGGVDRPLTVEDLPLPDVIPSDVSDEPAGRLVQFDADGRLTDAEQPALPENRGLTLIADSEGEAAALRDPTRIGKIAQYLMRFVLTGRYDRPGPVWFDERGRFRAWIGWHRDNSDDSQHRAIEIKTSVPETDPYNPDELVTRMSVRTEDPDDSTSRFTALIFNWLSNVELNWGFLRRDVPLPLRWRSPRAAPGDPSAGTGTVAQVSATVGADGSLTQSFDLGIGASASAFGTDRNGRIRHGRDTDTGTRTLFTTFYKGDGSSTVAAELNHKTGDLTLTRDLHVGRQIITPKVLAPDSLASSSCRTMPGEAASSNLPGSTGTVWAARAEAKVAGTFTKIRCAVGTTAPSGVTRLKLGVWDAARALVSGSVEGAAQATGTNVVIEVALDTPVTVVEGDVLYLGLACVFSSAMSFRGWSGVAAVNALTGRAVSGASSWASGTLPNLSTTGTGNLPWVELVP
jgi:hypothetical protein